MIMKTEPNYYLLIAMISIMVNVLLLDILDKHVTKATTAIVDLNLSETARNQLAEDYNSAILNSDQSIGDIIHNAQFSCAMQINDEGEPSDFKGLPTENMKMCETIENIELYPDRQGEYYFAKSSVGGEL